MMPRGRSRGRGRPVPEPEPVGRPNTRRGRKRAADELEEAVDDRLLQTDAGRSNTVDFELLLREAQLIPNCNAGNTNVSNYNSNTGWGEPVQAVERGNLSNLEHENRQAVNEVTTHVPHVLCSPVLPSASFQSTSNICNDVSVPRLRVANDDIAAHLPASLKTQICKGAYVNLALMLKGAIELTEYCSGTVFKLSSDGHMETSQKECKDKINDIEKWTNAFLIYSSVYLSTHADKVYELLHYMYNIREVALKQGSLQWREYDEQFRLRQAVSPIPWSQINNELWWRCMQLRPVMRSANNPYRYSCNDFNSGRCTWSNCRFAHTCSKCQGQHPATRCFRQAGSPTRNTGQATYPVNISFRGRPFQRRGSFRPPRR